MNRELQQFSLYVLVLVAFIVAAVLLVPAVDAGDPEPSFPPDVQPSPICGLYPGWVPGEQFGVGPGDVIECPPAEGPDGPTPSGTVELLADETPRPTPIVVGEPLGSEIPAVEGITLPETDTTP